MQCLALLTPRGPHKQGSNSYTTHNDLLHKRQRPEPQRKGDSSQPGPCSEWGKGQDSEPVVLDSRFSAHTAQPTFFKFKVQYFMEEAVWT